jgi:ketosteroid isomerase-like protein
MAKSRKKKPARRKSAKRRSSVSKSSRKRGGGWQLLFVAVLALLIGVASGWHFRDSGIAAKAATGTQAQAARPAALRIGEVEREGRKAVDAWLKTVASGNVAAVRAVLAPEFQIARADGAAYTAGEYVRSGLPRIDTAPTADRVTVTSQGDHLIARYWVKVSETVGGKRVDAYAPRMTVFRKSGDAWLVVAHANFAPIGR